MFHETYALTSSSSALSSISPSRSQSGLLGQGHPQSDHLGTLVHRPRSGFPIRLSVYLSRRAYLPCLVRQVASPPEEDEAQTYGDPVNDRIPQPQHCAYTPALLVMVPSFLELFHLQQPKEGVSKCPISVPHISNDEPLCVLSPRRRSSAGGRSSSIPNRTVPPPLRRWKGSTAFNCLARPRYAPCLNLLATVASASSRVSFMVSLNICLDHGGLVALLLVEAPRRRMFFATKTYC